MKFGAIHSNKDHWPISRMCRVFGVSPSGYYARCSRPMSARQKQNYRLAIEIATIHKRSRGTYGSPRAHAEITDKGTKVGRKRIAKIMRINGLMSIRQENYRKTTDSNHVLPIAPNRLNRQFRTDQADRVCGGGVKAIRTQVGWLFLAVLIDPFSRRIVGCSFSDTNDSQLVKTALERAVRIRRPTSALVHHSDRDRPYASQVYRSTLKEFGMRPSMSGKGDRWDNAVAESFFKNLRSEHLDHLQSQSPGMMDASVADYIENFYNPIRRHSFPGCRSPIDFELSYARSKTHAN